MCIAIVYSVVNLASQKEIAIDFKTWSKLEVELLLSKYCDLDNSTCSKYLN